MLALVDGEPRIISLKQMLRVFVEHRLEVIRRRSEYDLTRAQERAHILEGLLKAIDNIDEAIAIIRKSRTTETAHENLRKAFALSDAQATAILEMQLRRLAALERKKLDDELKEKLKLIKDLTTLLASPKLMRLAVSRETAELKELYADQRRTVIAMTEVADVSSGDLMGQQENTWVTLTTKGKLSIPHDDQAPKVSASMKEPPYRVLESNPSDTLYLITDQGQCATVLTSQIPKANAIEEGMNFWQLSDLKEQDWVTQLVNLPTHKMTGFLFFVTEGGEVKRLNVDDLPSMRANNFKIFDVEAGDHLRWAFFVDEEDTVILVTRTGQAIHFAVSDVRPSGLSAGGMRGIKLSSEEGDKVVGAGVVGKNSHVWVVTEGGYGKRTSTEEYPTQGRAGGGVRTLRFPPGNDQSIGVALVGNLEVEMVALTNKGTAKRNRLTNTVVAKRDAKGEPNVVSLAKGETVIEAFFYEARPEAEKQITDEAVPV
jgi:DNA gyrase subunit A